MTSIRRRLLTWLVCGFAIASLIAAYGIFRTARHEAAELFDYELRAVALSIPANLGVAQRIEDAERGGKGYSGIDDDEILIQIWDDQGREAYHSQHVVSLPRGGAGFNVLRHNGETWRVFGLQRPDAFVQVAQPYGIRDSLGRQLALHTIWPLALLVPMSIALVLFVVARGLLPIRELSTHLTTRSLSALHPLVLDADTPLELVPLVHALNDLLARLRLASQAQQNFIADAAHELRSPLAALSLQVQSTIRSGELRGETHILDRISVRLSRLVRLVHQLLSLAHEDSDTPAKLKPASLRKIAETIIGEFSLLAEEKSIDLGLVVHSDRPGRDTFEARVDPHGLHTLIGNLVDNAIRYVPCGGQVDLVLVHNGDDTSIQVVDNGPGIPEEHIDRAFDRFYRANAPQGTGSGLGLSIAARIAARHGAQLTLANNADGVGLTASLTRLKPL
ncbi:two-component sensor histidine kinase [Paraburkholderia sp. Ac-20340]|uniref:ATP-binding protein n=1 Tax=Paraburkholderia sp. Ac-20340 TaxID=2703888 RepID=UPI0019822BE5|nr:ATP-binding protein [Paraburkholderia sp. Ac-20340]MBN3857504.1 two-component sensor histidine kinase [Paraburkholderia sp. Ac-20340]